MAYMSINTYEDVVLAQIFTNMLVAIYNLILVRAMTPLLLRRTYQVKPALLIGPALKHLVQIATLDTSPLSMSLER